MITRPQAEAQLARLRKMQTENDGAMVAAREEVDTWLNSTVLALHREIHYLRDKGDVADAEIQTPWELLQRAIGRLRGAQALRVKLTRDIADVLADLADESLWR